VKTTSDARAKWLNYRRSGVPIVAASLRTVKRIQRQQLAVRASSATWELVAMPIGTLVGRTNRL
jgi:hypothetical protein